MVRRFLTLALILFSSVSCFAGELEDAAKQDKTIFLYLYTPNCGYCRSFSPHYSKLSKMYDRKLTFLKIDASTHYGYRLMKNFRASYVPYVLLIDPKTSNARSISTDCLMDMVCIEKAIKSF